MITKTILTQMELLSESRGVIAHFVLVAYADDGTEMMRSNPHTVTMMPDADYAAVLAANNTDITTRKGMGWPAIDSADWTRVMSHVSIEQTPDVIAAYKAAVAAATAVPIAAQTPQ